MIIKRCIFCKKKDFDLIWTVRKPFLFSVYMCRNCKLYFQNPLPTKKRLKKFYEQIYNKECHFPCAEEAFETKDKKQELKRIKEIEKFKTSGKLLDVGASTGFFLSEISKRKQWEGWGIEYSKRAVERAKKKYKNIKILIGEVDSQKIPNNYFDVITMHSVFEHLPDPQNQLAQMKKKLKKEGLIVLSVPNMDSFEYWFFRLFKKSFPGFIYEHLFYYNPKTITEMLIKNGFEVVYITSRHYSSLRTPPIRPLIGLLTFIPKLFLEYTTIGGSLKLGNILYIYAKKVN